MEPGNKENLLFYNDLKLSESVNIFTDVSTSQVKLNDKKSILVNSLGMIISYGSLIPGQTIKIIVDEHNVVGEAKAIELAVMWIISHANPKFPYYYNIFTDSQTSVEAINGYLSNYFTNTHSATKRKVFNLLESDETSKKKTNFDNIIKIIVYLILTNRLPIRIIYIPAHIDLEKNKDGEIKKAITKFQNHNKYFHFYINYAEMYMLLSGNHAIDYLTRAYLLNNLPFIQQDIIKTSYTIQYGVKRDIPLIWPYSFYDKNNFFIAGYQTQQQQQMQFDELTPVPLFVLPKLEIL